MHRNAVVAKHLAVEGVCTHVVLPDSPGNAAQRLRDQGVNVIQVPLHRLRATRSPRVHLAYLRAFRSEVRRLQQLIRDLNIDVVVVNGSANPHAALAAQREGVAVVWQLLDTYPPRAFLSAVMLLIRRWADVIMANGMTTAAMHPGAIESSCVIIPFGPSVPLELFRPSATLRARARAQFGLSGNDFVIGTMNNVNPMKGHRTFVRAAGILRERVDARFVILGGASDAGYLTQLLDEARGSGLVLGETLFVRDAASEVHELAQAFDVFWLTSEPRAEGMSNSLAEAQAMGIPVIATRSGAVHECLVDGQTGYVVPPHDVDAIVDRTIRLREDRVLYDSLSAAAVDFVRGKFSSDVAAARHLEAYQEAIRLRRRRVG